METGVLGNALDGVPDEEQGDSDGEAENVENPDKVPLEGKLKTLINRFEYCLQAGF